MATEVEQKKLSEAQFVYKTLCTSLDDRKWTYNKDDEKLIVRTSAVGDDLAIKLYIKVDASRSVMFLKSPMPFNVTPQNRDALMLSITHANWAMLNGMFEMDLNEGYVGFKVVIPFMDSLISESLCKYLIDMSCRMVDAFNDKLDAVAKGTMTVAEFAEFSKKAI